MKDTKAGEDEVEEFVWVWEVQLYKGELSLNIHGPIKVSNWESPKLDPTWDNGYWK